MADVLAFRVGRRYPAKRLRFPMPEASQYSFDKRGHLLQLFWSGPLPRETKAVREGEARFALAAEGPGIFLCYRFGDMAWGGSPCSVHLVPETRRTTTGLDPETGEPRNLLEIHLVDARSGILRAMRLFWLDRTFTDAFEEALRGQVAAGWAGREAYESALAGVYRRYPRSSDLARAPSPVRTSPGSWGPERGRRPRPRSGFTDRKRLDSFRNAAARATDAALEDRPADWPDLVPLEDPGEYGGGIAEHPGGRPFEVGAKPKG